MGGYVASQPKRTSAETLRSGLDRSARSPSVGGFGVLPEVGFGTSRRFRGNVFRDDCEGLVVRRDLIAVGPIAAEDDAVRSEEVPERIKLLAVILLIANEHAVFDGRDLGEFYVNLWMLREGCQIMAIYCDGVGIGDHSRIGQVIDDDTESRKSICDSKKSADQAWIRICAFEYQACLGERFEDIDKVRLFQVSKQIAVPEVSVTDAKEEGIPVQPVKLAGAGRIAGVEISNDAEDERVGFGHLEQPVIVSQ